jgi:glycosyltransferase involved in cell wall biosynthesis
VRDFGNLLLSWYLGKGLSRLTNCRLAAVISNGAVGWYIPNFNGNSPRKVHIYHGTYRAQAEAIRPFITHLGYLKLKWWDSMVLERACGAGKQVLCNSDQTRQEVQRYFGRQGVITWLPLDTCHFRPLDQAACRNRLGLPEQGPVGLFAGSTHPSKGFPVVRSLIRALPGVRWLLALRGGIPAELQPEQEVRVFQDAPYDLLPTLYGAADFVVLPSRYESFGYTVAEALACGTPVIASPGGASRLFLQEPPLDSLLIANPTDSEQFLAAAQSVLSDTQAYKEAAIQKARPAVVQAMARETWWPRFFAATGL